MTNNTINKIFLKQSYITLGNALLLCAAVYCCWSNYFYFTTYYYLFIYIFLINYIIIKWILRKETNTIAVNLWINYFNSVVAGNCLTLLSIVFYPLLSVSILDTSVYQASISSGASYFRVYSDVTLWISCLILLLFICTLIMIKSETYHSLEHRLEIILILALACILALFILVSADISMLWALIEILAICLICLIISQLPGGKSAALAVATKYFIFSTIFSIMALLGCVTLLWEFGTTDLSALHAMLTYDYYTSRISWISAAGAGCILAILLFKMGLSPMSSFSNEVSRAVLYPVLHFYLNIFKLSIFGAFLNVYWSLFTLVFSAKVLAAVLAVAGLLSIVVAIAGAYSARELKLFFSYTSLFNYGLSFIVLAYGGSTSAATAAAVCSLIVYSIAASTCMVFISQVRRGDDSEAIAYTQELFFVITDYTVNLRYAQMESAIITWIVRRAMLTIKIFCFVVTLATLSSLPLSSLFFIKFWILYIFVALSDWYVSAVVVLASGAATVYYFFLSMNAFGFLNTNSIKKYSKMNYRYNSDWKAPTAAILFSVIIMAVLPIALWNPSFVATVVGHSGFFFY